MAEFKKIVERLRNMVLSFKGPINILICRLDLDSLATAFTLEYYVSCVLGNNGRIRIFYNGGIDQTFLRVMFDHFKLPNAGGIKNISEFDKEGNHIFIDATDSCGMKVPKNKLSVVIGDAGNEITHSHSKNTLIFHGHSLSACAIVFNIICKSGHFRFEEKGYGSIPFLLAIVMNQEIKQKNKKTEPNLNVYGRIMDYIEFSKFHRLYDELPREVLRVIEKI